MKTRQSNGPAGRCHLHADWNEIQTNGGPHQNPESPARHIKRIQDITYELKAGQGWTLAEGSQKRVLCTEKQGNIKIKDAFYACSRLSDVYLLLQCQRRTDE